MCGVVGIYVMPSDSVAPMLVNALTLLQHRGQDAAGVAVLSTTPMSSSTQLSGSLDIAAEVEQFTTENHLHYSPSLHLHRNVGQVSEVFSNKVVCASLVGNLGLGHVRYPTAGRGGGDVEEAQPFYTNYPYGIALVHNGNLTNTTELRRRLVRAKRHLNTESDSELLLNLFAEEMVQRMHHAESTEDGRKFDGDDSVLEMILDAIKAVMLSCRGGFAVLVLIHGVGMFAFRDPFGIRPLSLGISSDVDVNKVEEVCAEGSAEFVVASESVAIEALDGGRFRLLRDLHPGEVVAIRYDGRCEIRNVLSEDDVKDMEGNVHYCLRPCLFEYVYFARPDSILEGVHVHEARAQMGRYLAIRFLQRFPRHDVDCVIPIPETSRSAAQECARILNLPYREGFIKNRYIARTFIMPQDQPAEHTQCKSNNNNKQKTRSNAIRLKLNTIRSEFAGKCVLLIDDSIVRGNTSKELVRMARDAGAKEVYFASAGPPVLFPNVYGIDIPTSEELIAAKYFSANQGKLEISTPLLAQIEQQIAHEIEADYVLYNTLSDVRQAVQLLNPERLSHGFEDSCFSGDYIAGQPALRDSKQRHSLDELPSPPHLQPSGDSSTLAHK